MKLKHILHVFDKIKMIEVDSSEKECPNFYHFCIIDIDEQKMFWFNYDANDRLTIDYDQELEIINNQIVFHLGDVKFSLTLYETKIHDLKV